MKELREATQATPTRDCKIAKYQMMVEEFSSFASAYINTKNYVAVKTR